MKKAVPSMVFDRFVGVDWSGARDPGLPGLQVAMAADGRSPPCLVPPPGGGKLWTRCIFVDWLVKTLSGNDSVLVGFDFAFSFPYHDTGEFFPCAPDTPYTAFDLWRRVDKACGGAEDFYAGMFIEDQRYAPYFLLREKCGERYEHRLRLTDKRCHCMGLGRPESVFKLVGPSQVGKGSLAGMRVLHYLRRKMPRMRIWPFGLPSESRSDIVVVEVYSRAFARMSGIASGKVDDMGTLNRILESYDSEPLRGDVLGGRAPGDKADALIVAAALRHLSGRDGVWDPPGLYAARLWHEGWIFGVT